MGISSFQQIGLVFGFDIWYKANVCYSEHFLVYWLAALHVLRKVSKICPEVLLRADKLSMVL